MAFHSRNKIITDGLIFAYDAYNIKSYVSGDTVAYDLASGGGIATLENGVSFSGNSWVFDGVSTFMETPLLDIDTTTIDITFRYHDIGTTHVILRQGADPATLYMNIDASNNFKVFFRTNACPTSNTLDTGLNLVPETLYHMIYSVDWPTTTLRVHIDGILVLDLDFSSTCSAYEYDAGNTYPYISIGKNGSNNNGYFGGEIHSVYIYNKIFTDSEALHNYEAKKWRFK